MNATDSRVAEAATSARGTKDRLSILWVVGTGIALVPVALAFVVANRVEGALIVTGTG